MNLFSRVVRLVSSVVLAAGLAGCAVGPQKSDEHVHSGTGAMDMQAMCEKHKTMMSGKPAAERQAMMQEHMKAMTAEMRQRMQAMHGQCK